MAMTESFRAELLAPMCALAADRVANVRLAVARFFSVYRNASTIGTSAVPTKDEKEKEKETETKKLEEEKKKKEEMELSEEHKAALQRLRVTNLFQNSNYAFHSYRWSLLLRRIVIGTCGITSHIVRA